MEKKDKRTIPEIFELLRKEIIKKPDMEKVIKMFYTLQYRFVSSGFVDLKNKDVVWKKRHHHKSQWLVRLDHIDNDPTKDKYNTDILIGIRFFDRRAPFIIIYLEGKFHSVIKMPWLVNDTQNHRKKKVPLTFPEIMTIQDRTDWRKYHGRWKKGLLQTNAELNYYFMMKPHIGNLDKEELHLS